MNCGCVAQARAIIITRFKLGVRCLECKTRRIFRQTFIIFSAKFMSFTVDFMILNGKLDLLAARVAARSSAEIQKHLIVARYSTSFHYNKNYSAKNLHLAIIRMD